MSDRRWMRCRLMGRCALLGALLVRVMHLLFSSQIHLAETEFPVPHSCAHISVDSPSQPSAISSRQAKHRKASCSPKMDIMFMKTHKTASSTFLNILLRFGEKHGLKFAFPAGHNDFSYPSPFRRTDVQGYKPGTCYNIICNHMRFNAPEVAEVLPLDTSYVTILRDPAELFESSFHYFGPTVPLTWRIPSKSKMAEFLRNPQGYFDPNGINAFYLKNLLSFDLGLDNTLEPDDPRVDSGIAAIAERFQLVMLKEHFEESLILLGDALCWEMDDLLSFKLNTRMDSAVSKLTPELRARALEWNSADWRLYRHFNATFWKKVEEYGHMRMAKDLAQLSRRNAEMLTMCVEGGRAVEAASIQEWNMRPWQPLGEKSIMGYNLKKGTDAAHQELCRKMLTPEIRYLTELGVNLWKTRLWGHIRDIINW